MNLNLISLLLMFSLVSSCCSADNKIIAFFEQAPQSVIHSVKTELTKGSKKNQLISLDTTNPLKVSNELTSKILEKQLLPSLGGIPALYGGYLTYAKNIEFPLRHASQKLYIVVTPSIKVVPLQEQTVAYLSLDTASKIKTDKNKNITQDTTLSTTATPGMEAVINTTASEPAAKIYLLEKKQDEKKVWFWKVSEEPAPKNGKINPISLILITNPNNIFIKLGDRIATEEAHLRLPPLYVIGDADKDTNLLKFLDLSRYFEPLTKETKEEPELVKQSILTNN